MDGSTAAKARLDKRQYPRQGCPVRAVPRASSGRKRGTSQWHPSSFCDRPATVDGGILVWHEGRRHYPEAEVPGAEVERLR